MARHLDILAIEPYYGGLRRAMMETILRCSRHRWHLLKLPARRMERRLAAAARWFAEILTRVEKPLDEFDLLFTTEAINLPELQRLVPELAYKPSVVYFHDNQLPDPVHADLDNPTDLVNLNSAMAATRVWFNSQLHLQSFMDQAAALLELLPELRGQNPLGDLTQKSECVPPPVDMGLCMDLAAAEGLRPDPRTLFVDARHVVPELFTGVVQRLQDYNEQYGMFFLGRGLQLPENAPCTQLTERDDLGQIRALLQSGIYLSLRGGAYSDDFIVQALSLGCFPVVPDGGIYPDMIPPMQHLNCLHDCTPETVCDRINGYWYSEQLGGWEDEQQRILSRFDPLPATRLIDDHIELLVSGHTVRA